MEDNLEKLSNEKRCFIVWGEPKGKGRPRFNTRTGRAYTPVETENYENMMRFEYIRQCGNIKFPDDTMVGLDITAFFGIPQRDSKKTHAAKLSGEIRPMKKPDMDNIVKSVADSLNGTAYRDDAQIVECAVHKTFSEDPRLEIILYDVNYSALKYRA